MRHIDIVLFSASSPLLCGVYENNTLIEQVQSNELLLVALPRVFESLLPTPKQNPAYADSKINAIYYANGPGSFSALKLTHIFLHILSNLYDIRLFATSSFYFTQSAYIRAFGTSCFYRNENGEISLVQNVNQDVSNQNAINQNTTDSGVMKNNASFFLPQRLDKSAFNLPTEPLYILPPL